MDKDSKRPDITEAHKRGITTTLLIFDQALCEIEQWVGGREAHSALYEETNSLSALQRERIAAEVRNARKTLARVKSDLNLEGETHTAAGAILTLCSGLWEHLVELDGKHLRRYGRLPSGLDHYLSPQIAQLIEVLKRISDAVRS